MNLRTCYTRLPCVPELPGALPTAGCTLGSENLGGFKRDLGFDVGQKSKKFLNILLKLLFCAEMALFSGYKLSPV